MLNSVKWWCIKTHIYTPLCNSLIQLSVQFRTDRASARARIANVLSADTMGLALVISYNNAFLMRT